MPEKKETETLEPIDLMDVVQRFVRAFCRLWPLLIILGLLCSALFLFRAHRNFRTYYESTALFAVSSGYTADSIFSSSYYDNLAAQQLAEAFPHMLTMDLMQELMKQQLGKSYINGSISAQCVASSNMFKLTVRSTSAQDAYNILWAVIDCFPQVAVYMVDNPQVIIRTEPNMPTVPCNSFNPSSPALKGASVGIILALGVMLAVALLTKTVTSADQLKSLTNLPILAVFPLAREKKRRTEQPRFVMVTDHAVLAEPLRGLNLKVQKLLEADEKKLILITSTLGGEGKTTVAANLALSLASSGKKVVLVDADLRSQSVAERFNGSASPHSLLECLRSPRIPVEEQLIHVDGTGLYYLSGNSITTLRYSVDRQALDRILSTLKANFDFVILDTAPCAMVPDTSAMCRLADCVLYVVKPDYARQSQIIDTVNDLYAQDVQLAGFVLNSVPLNHGHYGYGYKYGYGYGYKYGYGKKSPYHRKSAEQATK